jgi:hypothetical protein
MVSTGQKMYIQGGNVRLMPVMTLVEWILTLSLLFDVHVLFLYDSL